MITPLVLVIVATASTPSELDAVLAHPPFAEYYMCGEHRKGELPYPGDDLGTDCVVHRLIEVEGRTWARAYSGDGTRNEDWYGWQAQLLAPCECTVVKLRLNPETNQPGILGKPPASSITFERDDGVRILLAHVQDVSVKEGERVAYGQPVARVGNNGYGRSPHVHVGAWKGETALQIRWDTSVAVE